MIRFVDREVLCVQDTKLENADVREQLNIYLHNDFVCIVNEVGEYEGYITLDSWADCTIDLRTAIVTDYLVMDAGIWEAARKYIRENEDYGISGLIPVVNTDKQLINFAYDDTDADRELRMLRELQEILNAHQFADIFPECEGVIIHGFNELAFFFVEYLKGQGISVCAEGDMWKGFCPCKPLELLENKVMHIYAEGIMPHSSNIRVNMLRSASVEFECVDKIYEANIKLGIIKNAFGTEKDFLEQLRKCKNIVIMGTGVDALDTYNYLVKNGIDIYCFANEDDSNKARSVFEKKILNCCEIRRTLDDVIWINPVERGSAWGLGNTDYYDYLGYKRNEQFFLVKDYVIPQSEGLVNVLKNHRIVCMGDRLLSDSLVNYMLKYEETRYNEFLYWDIDIELEDNIEESTYILIILPVVHSDEAERNRQEKKNAIVNFLQKNNIWHYTLYFSTIPALIGLQTREKNIVKHKPKKVVLGAIGGVGGTTFVKGLLDGHPNILTIHEEWLNDRLFWICMKLGNRRANEIMPLFWDMYYAEDNDGFDDKKDIFECKMNELLQEYKNVTSQDLFVLFCIAYCEIWREEKIDINDCVIYWEPHPLRKATIKEFAKWLNNGEINCFALDVSRNACQKSGSGVKGFLKMNWAGDSYKPIRAFRWIFAEMNIQEPYKVQEQIHIQFEDLKKRPEEVLNQLCELWEIPWSDTLMHTTLNGQRNVYFNGYKQISDFDLSPVYNLYEEYFSEFDRLRITLMCSPWQRKYGYPYTLPSIFSRRELYEMFLKEFRFFRKEDFIDGKKDMEFLFLQREIRKELNRIIFINYEMDLLEGEA